MLVNHCKKDANKQFVRGSENSDCRDFLYFAFISKFCPDHAHCIVYCALTNHSTLRPP